MHARWESAYRCRNIYLTAKKPYKNAHGRNYSVSTEQLVKYAPIQQATWGKCLWSDGISEHCIACSQMSLIATAYTEQMDIQMECIRGIDIQV